MYRYLIREQVRYGQFREYLEINRELQAHAKAKGWVPWTLMVPTVGAMNEAVTVFDYPSLEVFERESREAETDPDFMKLIRRSAELIVQGSGTTELLQTITDLA